MARKLGKSALVVMALVTAFTAGALTAIKLGWGSPLVTVYIHNNTSAPLQALNFSYGSCSTEGKAFRSGEPLAAGETRKFLFLVCSEGGYTVEAVLQNGSSLSSGGYVESGYISHEHVEPSRIRSASSLVGW